MRISHLTLDLSSRDEGSYGVDDDDIEGAATDEGISYLRACSPLSGWEK